MAEIEALGEKVGNSSAKIDAYETCRTRDEQLTQLDTLETQLHDLTTYLNDSNVQAWNRVIKELSLSGTGCQFVPMEWCRRVGYEHLGLLKSCVYNDETNQCEGL